MTFSRDSVGHPSKFIQPSFIAEEHFQELKEIDSFLSKSAEKLRNLMKSSIITSRDQSLA